MAGCSLRVVVSGRREDKLWEMPVMRIRAHTSVEASVMQLSRMKYARKQRDYERAFSEQGTWR